MARVEADDPVPVTRIAIIPAAFRRDTPPINDRGISVRQKRNWSVTWETLASDGTEWHNGLRSAALSGHKAKRIADLSLHKYDMDFCKKLLQEQGPKLVGDYGDLSRAVWIAIFSKVHFMFQKFGTGRAKPT